MLIAETRDDVTTLNQRARADLILDGTLTPGREVEFNDGTHRRGGGHVHYPTQRPPPTVREDLGAQRRCLDHHWRS
ncbi:hypothetical protein [Gordonia soli]|uniref:hypothetical protein n=1 Tax=Gordonia soli TaxID=320799 RepID=UPI00034CBB64|nr:hypothetical protein [Gordonia soli]